MVKLYNGGAWLVNGTEIVEDNKDASAVIANLTGKAPVSKKKLPKRQLHIQFLKNIIHPAIWMIYRLNLIN